MYLMLVLFRLPIYSAKLIRIVITIIEQLIIFWPFRPSTFWATIWSILNANADVYFFSPTFMRATMRTNKLSHLAVQVMASSELVAISRFPVDWTIVQNLFLVRYVNNNQQICPRYDNNKARDNQIPASDLWCESIPSKHPAPVNSNPAVE